MQSLNILLLQQDSVYDELKSLFLIELKRRRKIDHFRNKFVGRLLIRLAGRQIKRDLLVMYEGITSKVSDKEVKDALLDATRVPEEIYSNYKNGRSRTKYDFSFAVQLIIVAKLPYNRARQFMRKTGNDIGSIGTDVCCYVDALFSTLNTPTALNLIYSERLDVCEKILNELGLANGFIDLEEFLTPDKLQRKGINATYYYNRKQLNK